MHARGSHVAGPGRNASSEPRGHDAGIVIASAYEDAVTEKENAAAQTSTARPLLHDRLPSRRKEASKEAHVNCRTARFAARRLKDGLKTLHHVRARARGRAHPSACKAHVVVTHLTHDRECVAHAEIGRDLRAPLRERETSSWLTSTPTTVISSSSSCRRELELLRLG